MTKPKILFVYDHPKPEWWMDGLWAALNTLENDFSIKKFNFSRDGFSPAEVIDDNFDFTLGWGAFGSKVDSWMQLNTGAIGKYRYGKLGLCVAGNSFPPKGADNYHVLFHETKWYRPQISFHPNIVHAFGVNTDLFAPLHMHIPGLSTPIVWDYIGVGALAVWKRWEKMIDKPGMKLVIGEYQKDNETESLEIARKLLKSGVMVSPMVNPLDLATLYHYARTLYQPADIYGGGERSILEARSCGLSVEVEPDNQKLQELVKSEIKDHVWYAAQLKKGIMSVL